VACVSGDGVFSQWTKSKLKTLRLRESGVNKNWALIVSSRILHLEEESEDEERVYCCDAEVEGPSP
jgi:hypothetical protein